MIGLFGKLYNIVIHIHSAANCVKEFKALTGRLIPLNNWTRWNSWYLMLLIAIKKVGAIDTYLKNNFAILKNNYLSLSDWD